MALSDQLKALRDILAAQMEPMQIQRGMLGDQMELLDQRINRATSRLNSIAPAIATALEIEQDPPIQSPVSQTYAVVLEQLLMRGDVLWNEYNYVLANHPLATDMLSHLSNQIADNQTDIEQHINGQTLPPVEPVDPPVEGV